VLRPTPAFSALRHLRHVRKDLLPDVLFVGAHRQPHLAAGLTATDTPRYIYTTMNIDMFEALADRSRRRIVESLKGGERPVGEIVKHSGIHQSGVSRHLRILNEAGFVAVRPVGQQRLYSLKPEPFQEIEAWLAGYRSLWESRLDRFAEALEQRKSSRDPRRRTRT
jgi:DNA-binding transcriptional ArsR family regulator